jgi:hypothetical protein
MGHVFAERLFKEQEAFDQFDDIRGNTAGVQIQKEREREKKKLGPSMNRKAKKSRLLVRNRPGHKLQNWRKEAMWRGAR